MSITRKQRGFTLVELLVVMVAGLIITSVVLATTTSGLKGVRAAKRQERLHADALYVNDALGIWIKQTKGFTAPAAGSSGNTLTLELADGTTKTITLASGKITVNGTAITTSNSTISNLTFKRLGQSIKITANFAVPGGLETFPFQTTIAQRYVP